MATQNDYSCIESAVTFWSSLCLAIMSVTSLLLRYVTDHVTCWTPAQFEPPQVAYANRLCFQKQYIFSFDDEDPPVPRFTYHQWLPLFLGVCAVVCRLPDVFWRSLKSFLWLDKDTLLRTITSNQRSNASADRHVVMHDLALLLHAGLKGGNSSLTVATVARKVVVALVSFVELVLMAAVFSPQLRVPRESDDGGGRHDNGSIPLPLTHFRCSFEIRRMLDVYPYDVQCTMPLAQVYSKGLAFFFYLFLALFVLSALDMAVWAFRLIMPGVKDATLRRYLAVVMNQSDKGSDPASLDNFLQSLGSDGHLLLAITGDCCGPLAAADLTNHLWAVFKGTPRPGSDPPLTSIGSAHTTASEFASAPVIQITEKGDKDGGNVPSADGGKEKPC